MRETTPIGAERWGEVSSVREADRGDQGTVQCVILIERCRGVQVGHDNDQCSAYRATLPELEFKAREKLAQALLNEETLWVGDVFVFLHEVPRLRFSEPSGWRGSETREFSADAGRGAMVVVRDSCGVQVGDGNVQRNQFRARVIGAAVEADGLALTAERAALVARLQADPSDRAAARELAENVAQAAAEDLEADLTIEIAEIVAEPQIEGWSGTVRDRTGVQIGEGNEAEDTVQVNVLKWASAVLELERELLAEAVRRASLAAELDELEGGRDKSFLSQADAEAEIEGPELSL